jgi:hypothetical protein
MVASGPKCFEGTQPVNAAAPRWRAKRDAVTRAPRVIGSERRYVRRDKPYLRRLVRQYCDRSAAVGKMSVQDEASAEHPQLWKKHPLLPINHMCHAADGVQRRARRMRCADGRQWRRPDVVPEHGAPTVRAMAAMMPRLTASRADSPSRPPSHVCFPQSVRGPSPRVWLTRRRGTRRARGPSAVRRGRNSVSGTGKAESCPRRVRERHAAAYRTPCPVRGNSQGAYFAIDRTESGEVTRAGRLSRRESLSDR